jgi:stress-induced morphogen
VRSSSNMSDSSGASQTTNSHHISLADRGGSRFKQPDNAYQVGAKVARAQVPQSSDDDSRGNDSHKQSSNQIPETRLPSNASSMKIASPVKLSEELNTHRAGVPDAKAHQPTRSASVSESETLPSFSTSRTRHVASDHHSSVKSFNVNTSSPEFQTQRRQQRLRVVQLMLVMNAALLALTVAPTVSPAWLSDDLSGTSFGPFQICVADVPCAAWGMRIQKLSDFNHVCLRLAFAINKI